MSCLWYMLTRGKLYLLTTKKENRTNEKKMAYFWQVDQIFFFFFFLIGKNLRPTLSTLVKILWGQFVGIEPYGPTIRLTKSMTLLSILNALQIFFKFNKIIHHKKITIRFLITPYRLESKNKKYLLPSIPLC